MEVSLTQAFAFSLPGITVKNSCGMADESKSQPNKVAIIMLTIRFYDVALMSQTQAQTSAKLLFFPPRNKKKRKENDSFHRPTFYSDYSVLSNQSIYIGTHYNDCYNFEETKSLIFSRKMCQFLMVKCLTAYN